jgi:2-phosphosulfolactate phosphatase
MFTQDGYGVRLEWGADGVEALAPHCTVLIIVDVLTFSTSVDIVVGQGGKVRPIASDGNRRALRPSALVDILAGSTLELVTANGATLTTRAAGRAQVLAGCLRNAKAVAEKAVTVADRGPIGVIAAGEQWGVTMFQSGVPGRLRPAIEDQLGAGAIVSALLAEGYNPASPEAALAATTYRAAEPYLADLLAGCGSGLELAAKDLAADVELAGQVGTSTVAPHLVDGVFQ